MIVPVVSERLRIEKEWIVTEEIHITQLEEQETVDQKVRVNEEHARIERVDGQGNPIAEVDPTTSEESSGVPNRESMISSNSSLGSRSILSGKRAERG